MNKETKVRFYSGGTEDDKKALQLLMEANIPYIDFGPTSEIELPYTPYIEYGHWTFRGLKEIGNFVTYWVNNWELGKPPPLDPYK